MKVKVKDLTEDLSTGVLAKVVVSFHTKEEIEAWVAMTNCESELRTVIENNGGPDETREFVSKLSDYDKVWKPLQNIADEY